MILVSSDDDLILSEKDSVTLFVSMGKRTEYSFLPDFTGLDLSDASRLAEELGIALDGVSFVFSDEIEKGKVISQSRVYGERVPIDYTSVQICVSLGRS